MPTYACLYDVVWQTFAGPSNSDFTLFFWNQKFPIGLSSGRAYGSSRRISHVGPESSRPAENTKCKKLNARPQAGRTEASAVVEAHSWFESFLEESL